MAKRPIDLDRLRVKPGTNAGLAGRDPADTQGVEPADAEKALERGIEDLVRLQDVLYAERKHAALLVLQGVDAAGKDSVIKHVMRGLNPQGTSVTAFGPPSDEELDHDYLWRCVRALPRRGSVGVFNRSYYEEALVVRVHPERLAVERLPAEVVDDGIWERRFEQMRNFERHLAENGTAVVKVHLQISPEEQRKRFLARLGDPTKVWKFRLDDVRERAFWDSYQHAYEEALSSTSSDYAPWYVVPADHKWFARLAVAQILAETLEALPLAYPAVPDDERRRLEQARAELEADEGYSAGASSAASRITSSSSKLP
jgi:PPK2 family polyphosphate:nucleotide phosphotransferase